MDRVTLHKSNGTTITYKLVTRLITVRDNTIEFEDRTFGHVRSTLPYQINYNIPEATRADTLNPAN
jgi:hypothetical protein